MRSVGGLKRTRKCLVVILCKALEYVKCPRFSVQRELYFSELRLIYPDLINNVDDHRWKHKLVHNIVHGDEELSANLNQNMMNATTSFITDTKWF